MQHLGFAHPARPHGLVEALDVHAIHVPDNDGQHGKHGLGAVRGLGRRNELPRQHIDRRKRIPHHEARQGHDEDPPNQRPVLGFFLESVAAELRSRPGQTHVVHQGIPGIPDILQTWQHALPRPHHEDAVSDLHEVIDGHQHQDCGRHVMRRPEILNSAPESYDEK